MCAYMYNILCITTSPAKAKVLLQQLLTFGNSCASPMLFKSDPLPINSCARIRENLHIVIVGNSNLRAREAHSNPCAVSCGLTKMALSGWHYLLFSTAACLKPCQCRQNVSVIHCGMAAVAGRAGQAVAIQTVPGCPCAGGADVTQ